jgi:hypothetical protein
MGNDDSLLLKNAVVDAYKGIEDLQKEISEFKGDGIYNPKYNFTEFYNAFKERTDKKVYIDLVKQLNIKYIDETWKKSDWIAVFIAGSIGIILDVLITQTNILKPIDKKIAQFMQSDKMVSLKNALDKFSNSFRNGNSAPIDFQDFKMFGLKSIHEQYSFGHDPLRFIEGVLQIMTGNYRGVDKFGEIITAQFGQGIPNIFHAVISYVAHMISDFCNANSLPYPGSTFLMQFGSQKTRDSLAAAYRSQLYNSRTFVYQNLPSFLISVVIHSWAVYDSYTQTKKINFLIGKSLKYQPMLLVSNAMAMTSNLTITGVRAIMNDPHVLFRINWPVILNTVKHTIKYLVNENKRINSNSKKIKLLLDETTNNCLSQETEREYLASLDKEYIAFSKTIRLEEK